MNEEKKLSKYLKANTTWKKDKLICNKCGSRVYIDEEDLSVTCSGCDEL